MKKTGAGLIAAGLFIFSLGVYGLVHDIGWIAQPFYVYGWWGLILFLDGLVVWLSGESILTRLRARVIPLCIWSWSFWFFFEFLNLRYQNWYYVGVYDSFWLLYLFSLPCFATVFLGLFEINETIHALGILRGKVKRTYTYPGMVSYAVQGFGLAMIATSLLFPTYLAPLVWGSVSFLVDPWNYRHGRPSILRDFEQGNLARVARLLLAGLLCGLIWELLNFNAPQKWIYTVRGLENLKLFEMPMLGFLGFPALALDAVAVFSLLTHFFPGKQKQVSLKESSFPDLSHTSLPSPFNKRFLLSLIPQVIFCGIILYLLLQTNVGSFELHLTDCPSLTTADQIQLEELSIHRPGQLFQVIESELTLNNNLSKQPLPRIKGAREQLLTGWSEDHLNTVQNEIRLYLHKGIGAQYGQILQTLGIQQVETLCGKDPETLYAEMTHLQPDTLLPLRVEQVRVWTLAACQ